MNLPVYCSKGITNPFLPGCFLMFFESLSNALNILFRFGFDENLLTAQSTGFDNIIRSRFIFLLPAV